MDALLQRCSSGQRGIGVSVSREWTPFYSKILYTYLPRTVSVSREWTPFYSVFASRDLTNVKFPSAVNGRPSTAFSA